MMENSLNLCGYLYHGLRQIINAISDFHVISILKVFLSSALPNIVHRVSEASHAIRLAKITVILI
jgi:hypothetical protein